MKVIKHIDSLELVAEDDLEREMLEVMMMNEKVEIPQDWNSFKQGNKIFLMWRKCQEQ